MSGQLPPIGAGYAPMNNTMSPGWPTQPSAGSLESQARFEAMQASMEKAQAALDATMKAAEEIYQEMARRMDNVPPASSAQSAMEGRPEGGKLAAPTISVPAMEKPRPSELGGLEGAIGAANRAAADMQAAIDQVKAELKETIDKGFIR